MEYLIVVTETPTNTYTNPQTRTSKTDGKHAKEKGYIDIDKKG